MFGLSRRILEGVPIYSVRAGALSPAKSSEPLPSAYEAASVDGMVRIVSVPTDSKDEEIFEVRNGMNHLLLRVRAHLSSDIALTSSGGYLAYTTPTGSARLIAVPRQPLQKERIIAEWPQGDQSIVVDERDGWLAWREPENLKLLNTSTNESFSFEFPQDLQTDSIIIDRDGRRVAVVNSSDTDMNIAELQPENGKLRMRSDHPLTEAINAVAFTAEGRLVVGSDDNFAYVWPEREGASLQHDSPVTAVAPLPGHEDLLVTGAYDGTVHLWSLNTGRIGEPISLGSSRISMIEASKDGRIAVAYSEAWAHQLQIDTKGIRVLASLYLPTVRGTSKGIENGGQAVRAWLEPGQQPRAVRFDRSNVTELAGNPRKLLERWEQAIGLRFNDAGGVVSLWPDVSLLLPAIESKKPLSGTERSESPLQRPDQP